MQRTESVFVMRTATLDATAVKADFPLLSREVHGHPIVYLDSGATSQKPRRVLDAMDRYYEEINANIHRGAYQIAEQSTMAVEDSRAALARFVGAPSAAEIVFTKNATEAINLVAHSWGRTNLAEGEDPWLEVCCGRPLRIVGVYNTAAS